MHAPTNRYGIIALLLTSALVIACASPPARNIPPQAPPNLSGPETDTSTLAPAEKPASRTLHILHTNDFHGQILPRKGTWIDKDNPPDVGGADALAGYIAKVRAEVGEQNVVLVDSGDIFTGTPEGDLTQGRYVVELFNELRYDAVAVGNHEFDQGLMTFVGLKEGARFPIVSANLIPRPGEPGTTAARAIQPTAMISRGGVSIGIVGLTTPETPTITHKFAGQAFEFDDPATALNDAASTLKVEGADIILVISHVGKDDELKLAASAPPGVIAVLGGHSHTGIDPIVVSPNGVAYMQTWAKSSGIDHLVVEVGPDGARVVEGKLVPLMAADWQPSPLVAKINAKYGPQIEKIMSEVLGTCKAGLASNNQTVSSQLGSFITDTMREAAKTDLAITNKTGIRAEIPPGEVSMRTVHNVSPFANTLVSIKLTGKQLREVFEYAAARPDHRLELSGGEVQYDLDQAEGKRIKSFKVDGKPLDDKKTYTLATNSFLAGGGDGHVTLTKGEQTDTGLVDKEVLAAWFRKNKACPERLKGRILSNRP